MILEIAQLQVRPNQGGEFEMAFHIAESIISCMPGYLGHELQRCTEHDGNYMLLVRGKSIEAHTIGSQF